MPRMLLIRETVRLIVRVRRRAVCTALALACAVAMLGVTLFASEPEPSASAAQWFTLPNILAVAVLVFHFGSLRQELSEIRTAQADLKKWREEAVPDTYVRRDVFDEYKRRQAHGPNYGHE